MTVGELIEQLQQLDPDIQVFTRGYEGGYEDVKINIEDIRDIALGVHKEWYYGNHEDANHPYYPVESKTVVKGIIL